MQIAVNTYRFRLKPRGQSFIEYRKKLRLLIRATKILSTRVGRYLQRFFIPQKINLLEHELTI